MSGNIYTTRELYKSPRNADGTAQPGTNINVSGGLIFPISPVTWLEQQGGMYAQVEVLGWGGTSANIEIETSPVETDAWQMAGGGVVNLTGTQLSPTLTTGIIRVYAGVRPVRYRLRINNTNPYTSGGNLTLAVVTVRQ